MSPQHTPPKHHKTPAIYGGLVNRAVLLVVASKVRDLGFAMRTSWCSVGSQLDDICQLPTGNFVDQERKKKEWPPVRRGQGRGGMMTPSCFLAAQKRKAIEPV